MSERIAVVTTSYPGDADDASGHFVRSEVMDLVGAGHRVTVICPGRPLTRDANCPLSPSNLTVQRLGADRLFGWPGALNKAKAQPWVLLQLPGFVARARRVLRQGQFDRVIAHWLLGSGWPISLACDAPTEVVVHGSDARLLAKLAAPLRRHVLSSLQTHGVTLRLVAPHLEPLLRTPTNREWLRTAQVAPLRLTLPALGDATALRKDLGLPSTSFVAVVVGRLVTSKRIAVALRKAPVPPGSKLVVVGSGPLEGELRAEFPHVHFTGQIGRNEALRWVAAADVLVSASREEGAPTALREARLLGTAVWTAEFGSASRWASEDPGVKVLPELA